MEKKKLFSSLFPSGEWWFLPRASPACSSAWRLGDIRLSGPVFMLQQSLSAFSTPPAFRKFSLGPETVCLAVHSSFLKIYLFLFFNASGLSCSMWDLFIVPWLGIKPVPLHWEHRVLVTGRPAKSQLRFLEIISLEYALRFVGDCPYSGPSQVALDKESACRCRRCWSQGFNPWVGKIPWRRAWQPTSVFFPGESHGQRSLAGCGP